MTTPELNIEREELTLFLKRISPIKSEPLATAVAEEWADAFYTEFYPEKPEETSASEYYDQWQSEAVDTIQSALFERAGWSSEHYAAEFGKYRYEAEEISDKLFREPVWSLLGFAIRDLEGAANEQ